MVTQNTIVSMNSSVREAMEKWRFKALVLFSTMYNVQIEYIEVLVSASTQSQLRSVMVLLHSQGHFR